MVDISTFGAHARTLYRRWHWPVGWWRARGGATLRLAGVDLRFCDVAGSDAEWWAKAVRRNRWEAPVVEAFARAVRPGDVVYDVGAWIGPYTLLASKLVGPTGRVYAFEPDPVARRRLERNVTANGAQNVEVAPLALGRSSGSAFFSGGGSRGSVGQTGEVAVATVSLGEFAEQTGRAPDLMKVDIEGGELGLDTAALREVPQLFLEVHAPAFHREGVDPERFLREVAGEREVLRLEGGAENFNVRIGGAGSAPGAPQSRAGASSTRS